MFNYFKFGAPTTRRSKGESGGGGGKKPPGPSGGGVGKISSTAAKHNYQTFIYNSPMYNVYFRDIELNDQPSPNLVWCFFENPMDPDVGRINLNNPLSVLKTSRRESGVTREVVVINFTDPAGRTTKRTIRFKGVTPIRVNGRNINLPYFYIEIYNPVSGKSDMKLAGVIMRTTDFNILRNSEPAVARPHSPRTHSPTNSERELERVLAMDFEGPVGSPRQSPRRFSPNRSRGSYSDNSLNRMLIEAGESPIRHGNTGATSRRSQSPTDSERQREFDRIMGIQFFGKKRHNVKKQVKISLRSLKKDLRKVLKI
jgi:hypothetical protein